MNFAVIILMEFLKRKRHKENNMLELKANPILYMQLKEGETKEQAIERMQNTLERNGITYLQCSLTEENTELQEP